MLDSRDLVCSHVTFTTINIVRALKPDLSSASHVQKNHRSDLYAPHVNEAARSLGRCVYVSCVFLYIKIQFRRFDGNVMDLHL